MVEALTVTRAEPACRDAVLRGRWLRAAVVAIDLVAVAAGLAAATALWSTATTTSADEAAAVQTLTAAAVPAWFGSLASVRLYRGRHLDTAVDEVSAVLRAAALTTAALATMSLGLGIRAPRGWFALVICVVAATLLVERSVLRRWFAAARRRGRYLRPVLVVGAGAEGRAVAASFAQDGASGYRAVGFVDDDVPSGTELEGIPVVGPADAAVECAGDLGATGVVIASSALDHAAMSNLVRRCTASGLHVQLSSRLQDVRCRRLVVHAPGRHPLVYVEPCGTGLAPAVKRALDVLVAATALVAVTPALLTAMAAIRVGDGGPALFRQVRVGRRGRPFTMFKLRTMVPDAEAQRAELQARHDAAGPLFKLRDDPRVTPIGRWLRKLSVDELPQLVNVLRGDMSLVGPRPALPDEVAAWSPDLHERLRVRPGITGLWQVNGRSEASFDEYVRYDLYYVDNWSLSTDIAILLRTVPAVLLGRGAR